MPWVAFVDNELTEELDKLYGESNTKEKFPEHEFVGSCLRVGLTINDLKELTYVDIMKILLTFIEPKKDNNKKATQKDIDRLLG